MSEQSFTVLELNTFIKDILASGLPGTVWVCGEIQGYDRGKDKKHIFFELCQKDPATHEIIARVGLVIFASAKPRIDALLKRAENGFALKDDIEVRFSCRVDFYPAHGQVRLVVESIDPVYTLGKIAQDRQRLIATLKASGILERNKALAMPRVPLRIGLITSYDSAAYHDFVDELRRSGFGFKVYVVNAVMQGKYTEGSIVGALQTLGRMEVDLVVITRGGGSIAELSAFDSRLIAESIGRCQLPVLCGIGHEINTTIADLAAHTYAKTPTAIARFLVGRLQEFLDHVKEKETDLQVGLQRFLDGQKMRLKDSASFVQSGTRRLVKNHQEHLIRLEQSFRQGPVLRLKASRQGCLQKREELKRTIHLHLQNSRIKIENYKKLVELTDPKKIFKRGFSITRSAEGKTIRSVKDVPLKGKLTTVLADGSLTSEVVEKTNV